MAIKNSVKLGAFMDHFITIPKGKQSEVKARYELADKKFTSTISKRSSDW